MADQEGAPLQAQRTAPSSRNSKRSSRITEVVVVVVIIGIIIAAAAYGETITAFFRLHLWDKGAASRTVEEFMTAVQKGDEQKAQSFVESRELKPLSEGGKWRGYYMVSIAGRVDYLPQDLAPTQGAPKASDPEFMTLGDIAEVKTTLDSGKPLKYRLKMKDGAWKIQEILGGRIHH
jgi:hypothetical protein